MHAHLETNFKAPKTSNEYEIFKYILPSGKIIQIYKNLQATQGVGNASIKLFEKSPDKKLTLPFQSSPCNIDCE